MSSDLLVVNKAGGEERHQERNEERGGREQVANVGGGLHYNLQDLPSNYIHHTLSTWDMCMHHSDSLECLSALYIHNVL